MRAGDPANVIEVDDSTIELDGHTFRRIDALLIIDGCYLIAAGLIASVEPDSMDNYAAVNLREGGSVTLYDIHSETVLTALEALSFI